MSSQVAEVSSKYLAEAAKNAVPTGYKQTEVGVIPEDWDVVEFGSTLKEFRNGYAFSTSGYASTGTPIITMAQIGLSGLFQFDVSKVNKWDSQQHDSLKDFWVRDGDLLIAMTDVTPDKNLIGQMTVAKLDGIALLNQRVGLLRLKNEIAYSGYFNFLSSLPVWKTYCKAVASLGVQANISTSDIRKAKVPLPPIKEQTAIANALSDVDALISELEKLIAKKQAIKIATMQQLLTGRTRLPQFALREDGTPKGTKPSELGEIPEDWEVVALKDLLKDSPKYGINAPAVPLEGKLPVYIRITDISEDGYFKPTEKVGVKSPFSDLYQLADGDLVLARTGASVGKSYLYRPEDGVLVYAGFLIKVTPEQSKLDPKFLFQYLQTERYWSWVTVNSMRSGQPGINGNEYGSLMLTWPEKDEQTAIATILSDMDAEIQALEQRLGKTRQIKQGMMQELLTGKTRLIQGEAHD
ncbi:restriction endonuclease subunit S [Methylophaga thalassica]|uniref:Restriction endonuclease subunit S n=1 Tax=Methylophaga thalassica TaxID=40223 RepID=A0ABQ5TVI7_9GAMM|nr:restriction endonuclease subunit S [Methylophaga thalassica]GLP99999.1 restriction endonuclease subunit S [Methylophaga thalassica]